ncbi:MAG: tRNA lysidine(34) synthetase TilS [Chitinophagales bacterium]|nr:tRNA lysidine(34) synthetase TilS [Chitinophagales bacterium]
MHTNPESAIKSFKWLSKSTPILIACSGGRDSMALLYALHKLEFNHMEVAHCNFQLRGEESDGDQIFVEEYCKHNKIPFHVVRFETKELAKKEGVSTQMAARTLRYEWLEKIRLENGLHLIAVAHHQDDQYETILLQLIKGTGIHGLKGMLDKNDKIVRPLLTVSREQINQYVTENNIGFREDSSNATTHYKRNLIRHELTPLIAQMNPNYLQEFTDFGQRMREAEYMFEEYVQRVRKKVMKPWKEGYQIFFTYLLNHPSCDTLFYELLSPFAFGKEQVKEMLSTIKGLKKENASGQTFLSSQYRVILDKKSLYILPLNTELTSILTIDKWPKQILFNEYKIDVRLCPIEKLNMHKSSKYAYLDADKISFPVQMRFAEMGDYFYPFGMGKKQNPEKAGKKKLSKFFKDEQIPLAERERTPILLSKERVLWVLPHRIDDRFKVTEATQSVVVLTIVKSN